MRLLFSITLVVICLFSCSKPDFTITSADLLGEWRSKNAFINGQPASDFLNGNELYPSILGFKEDDFYYLNYSSGDWNLEDNIITLSNQGEFKILAYQDSVLTIEGEITAGQLYWPLEGIPGGEKILLKEDYHRR